MSNEIKQKLWNHVSQTKRITGHLDGLFFYRLAHAVYVINDETIFFDSEPFKH